MGQSRHCCGSPTEVGPMGLYSSSDQQLAVVFVTEALLRQLGQRLPHRACAVFIAVGAMNE